MEVFVKRILIIGIFMIAIIATFMFFLKKDYKTENFGNTINSSSIQEYILNMKSYEAEVEITIKSNKNENKYLAKQEATLEKAKQEILEPEHIKGIKIQYENHELTIENSRLNISKLYQNYPYIQENVLFLTSFIEEYKNTSYNKKIENEKEIILEIKNPENKYHNCKRLYIDKETKKPTKLEVQDSTQNMIVYILYNEIKIQ